MSKPNYGSRQFRLLDRAKLFSPGVLWTLLLIGACDLFTAPLPNGAQRFVAPAIYATWWEYTQDCSGARGNISDVGWYVVPGAATIANLDGSQVNGRWTSDNRIVLAGLSQFDGQLVRHEMLHALLRGGGHSRQAFVVRCGGTVACEDACLVEAGGAAAADPSATPSTPAVLEITTALSRNELRAVTNDGQFAFVVSARNPTGGPLLVQLPPSGDFGPSVSFSYRYIQDGSTHFYDMRAYATEVTRFAAGETKKFIFDFRVGTNGLTSGMYRFEGAYGERWAANTPVLTIIP